MIFAKTRKVADCDGADSASGSSINETDPQTAFLSSLTLQERDALFVELLPRIYQGDADQRWGSLVRLYYALYSGVPEQNRILNRMSFEELRGGKRNTDGCQG